MDTVSHEHLLYAGDLRAFVDALSDITGSPASMVIRVRCEVLERQLLRRSDDMSEVLWVGRLLQAARVEADYELPRGGIDGHQPRPHQPQGDLA